MSLPTLFLRTITLGIFMALLTLSVSVIPSLTHAQSNSLSQNSATTPVYDDRYRVQSTLINMIGAAICGLSGIDIINPEQGCLGIDPVNHKLSYDPNPQNKKELGGLLGMSTSMVSGLYVRPITTMSYISYLRNNFGVGSKTFAQDAPPTTNNQGFDNLSSLQDVWITTRNISYFLFTIVFVFIGIAIMLRLKIDPRTVMSIQNQIPKVIIAIIMITFSYAIVGVLIDMMWVTTYTGINLLSPSDSVREGATKHLINNPFYYVSNLFSFEQTDGEQGATGLTGISGSVGRSLGDIMSTTITSTLGLEEATNGCSGGHWYTLGIDVKDCIENGIKGFFKYLIAAIAFLVILVAIFLALFRVWVTLLKALVYIIIYTVIAPFVIIAGLVPGSTFGFSRWIRTILAHLIVFPVTVFILLLARILAFNPQINDPKQVTFLPPLVANPNAFDNFGMLIAFGLIMVAPEMLGFMQAALKAKPGPVGDIINKGFQAGVPAGTAVPKNLWSRAWKYDLAKGEIGSLGSLRMRASEKFDRTMLGRRMSNRQRFLDESRRAGSRVQQDIQRRGMGVHAVDENPET